VKGGRLATALVPALILRAPAPAAAQASTGVWNAHVGAHASWYSDPFSGVPGQPGYVEGFRAGVGYTLNSPRTVVAFDAYGMGVMTQGTGAADHFNYAGAIAVTRHSTPRLTLRFSEAIVSVYSNGAPALAAEGLVYPLTMTRTNDLMAGFTYQFTPRTSFTLTARHDLAGFDSTSGLTNGWQFRTSASLARQVSATDAVHITYSYRYSAFQDAAAPNTNTNSLTAGWGRELSERYSVALDAGVSRLNRVDTPGQTGFVADAVVTRRLNMGSLSARYRHGFSQAYGYGSDRVYDTVGLAYARTLTRELSGTISAVYGRSRDPYDPLKGFDTQNYHLGLQYLLARGWVAGASYAWLSRDPVGGLVQSTNNVNASLTYGWEWR